MIGPGRNDIVCEQVPLSHAPGRGDKASNERFASRQSYRLVVDISNSG